MIYICVCYWTRIFIFRSDLVEVIGKRGKKVPILLPPEVAYSMALLAASRQKCNVLTKNRYFFAAPFYNGYIPGHTSMRNVCKKLQLKRPDLLTAKELRRHVGTMCQVLQLNSNELEWLARHLGHNINIHKEFYQLHHSTIELSRVSMLLMMLDMGKATSFANRNLKEITLKGIIIIFIIYRIRFIDAVKAFD